MNGTPEAHSPLALDATAQAALVRSGEMSADELVALSRARIAETNDALGAVIYLDDDARDVTGGGGEFSGVPILLKDLGVAASGHPDHQGSIARKRAGKTFDHDSVFVQRLRAAGFVLLGRTNSAELGLYSDTTNAAYGTTRNPWDTEKSTGGSSGGAAASVASAMVAVAQGTDGGGSIRNPAAHCGVVGLKVSRGLISTAPDGESMFGISQAGVLTRSVRDTAALLDVLAGPELGDAVVAPRAKASFLVESLAGRRGLRVGVLDHDPANLYDVDPEIRAAVRSTAEVLESLGQHVKSSWPAVMFDADFADNWFRTLLPFAELARSAALSPGVKAEFDPITEFWAERARGQSSADQVAAMQWLDVFRRRMLGWFDDFDVLVTPVLPLLPQPVGFLAGADGIEESIRILRFTPQINTTGIPAITVPVGVSASGLPLAVQLVGRYGEDHVLLDLATQLEAAQPWRLSTLAP